MHFGSQLFNLREAKTVYPQKRSVPSGKPDRTTGVVIGYVFGALERRANRVLDLSGNGHDGLCYCGLRRGKSILEFFETAILLDVLFHHAA